MRIENGHAILERKLCHVCNGTREYTPFKDCPRQGKPQNGKPCPYCGSKTKSGHRWLKGEPRVCTNPRCADDGTEPETSYDYAPRDTWPALEFKVVYHLHRSATWTEYNLGIGYLYTVTDYGSSGELTDDQLIEKVRADRESSSVQLSQLLADRSDTSPTPKLAPFVAIIRRNDGYNVRAATPADVEASTQIA